ncbi:MAG TPA: poly-gamma-glutamate hydrolase family protein [Burkholderiales bacterium]|nr:poly-gamma-glutamate hydrolase family protein [Burkholderiales bacterium]
MADDKYTRFGALAATEKRRKDYDFQSRRKVASGVVVIAPHGGTIEPRTDKIANAIAGRDFSFYCFKALKTDSGLHIASHLFDEPTCEKLVAAHQHVVSIHGWGAKGERVCLGGLDSKLIAALKKGLAAKGIEVENAAGPLSGTDPSNIVNRGATGRGVQFELTMGFRRNAATVKKFTAAVRAVLFDA